MIWSKEFSDKTFTQFTSLAHEFIAIFIGLQLGKIFHHTRINAAGVSRAVHLLNSIGLIFSFWVVLELTIGSVFADDTIQSAGSIDQSLAQNASRRGRILGNYSTDLNHDDCQDTNDIRLPEIKLIPQDGLVLTNGNEGHFNSCRILAFDENSHDEIPSKLDSLASQIGYCLIDEKFRQTILSAGQFINLDFGVSHARIVQLSLGSFTFENKSIDLRAPLLDGIHRLVEVLNAGPSVLRVNYFGTLPGFELAKKRVVFLKQPIEVRRKTIKSYCKLPIKIGLISANG